MSTSAAPYWPGDVNTQIYQNLAYNSTTSILTLSPFGNSVDLTTSGSGGSFSTITVSSIGANVSFTGNVNLINSNTFTAPNVNASNISTNNISTTNVNLSTINGNAYPIIPAAAQTAWVSTLYSIPNQSLNGNPISTLSTFSSQPFVFNDFWNYTGPMTFLTNWNGSGNTNNLRNNSNTGPASFYRQINISTTTTGGEVGQVVAVETTGNALSGSYGPKSVMSTFQTSYSGVISYPMSVQLNGNGGSFYTGSGAEANITVYGAGTVIIQDSIDFYLDSGDPGANYGFTYAAPVNAANDNATGACITWR